MVERVIAGIDGLEGGRDAIALARVLAPDAELVLGAAYPFDETPSRFALLGFGNALREQVEHDARRDRAEAGVPAARIELLADTSPARALHRLAESEHAGLLVVGSSRRGRLGRALLGDVSRSALHGSPCPVAVAPRGYVPAPVRAIGVAFDASPEAGEALRFAAGLAAALGARLLVRTAVEMPAGLSTVGGYAVSVDELLQSLRTEAQSDLDAALAGLEGVEATGAAVIGTVPGVIDELRGETDVLVAGSRCWGAIRRVALGSTADRLIHELSCPVVVVPRSAVAGDGDPAAGDLAAARR